MVKLPFLLFSFLFLSLPIRENETTGNASQQDEEFPEVGYSITGPDFTYSQEIPSLSGLDFKNFVVHTFDEKGRHFICGRLRDGYWKAVVEKGTTWEALTWVGSYPLSSASPQTEYVLVAFEYWGASGSSDSEGYAQVWQFQDKKLKIVLQIDANTHFGGPEDKYYSFDPEKQILKMRSSHYLPGDAHCCISAYDELTFEWAGSEFRLKRKTMHLTEYGRSAGKNLPR